MPEEMAWRRRKTAECQWRTTVAVAAIVVAVPANQRHVAVDDEGGGGGGGGWCCAAAAGVAVDLRPNPKRDGREDGTQK